MITEVIFDIETKKLFNETENNLPEELGVSIVSAYKRSLDDNLAEIEGELFSFWEDDLKKLWEIFSNSDRIIGFNSLGFDVPVLMPLAPYPLRKLNHFDIMDEFKKVTGRRISLNSLARDNLGVAKTDVGTNAVYYWRKGDAESLAKLQKYCEADVVITKDLYDHVLKNKKLKYKDRWNSLREIEIDFSYPKVETQGEEQIGLF